MRKSTFSSSTSTSSSYIGNNVNGTTSDLEVSVITGSHPSEEDMNTSLCSRDPIMITPGGNTGTSSSICPSAHVAMYIPYDWSGHRGGSDEAMSTSSQSSSSTNSSSSSSSSSSSEIRNITPGTSPKYIDSSGTYIRSSFKNYYDSLFYNSQILSTSTTTQQQGQSLQSSPLLHHTSTPSLPHSPSLSTASSSQTSQSPVEGGISGSGEALSMCGNTPCTMSRGTQCDFPEEEPKIIKLLNKSKQMCSLLSHKKNKNKNKASIQLEAGNDFQRRLNSVLHLSKFKNNIDEDDSGELETTSDHANDNTNDSFDNSNLMESCPIPSQRPDPPNTSENSPPEPTMSIVNPFEDPDLDLDQFNEEDDPYNLTFDFSLPSSEDSSPHRFIFNSRYTVYTISGSIANSLNSQGRYSFKSLSTAHL